MNPAMLRKGAVHWSDLKLIGKSPAHYAHALRCEYREQTREMRVGTATDALLFGHRRVEVYPGKTRNGKEWDAFAALHADAVIVNESEWCASEAAANALRADPTATRFAGGWRADTFQRPLEWEMCGLKFRTRGCDILDAGMSTLADVKTTHSCQPRIFSRHAWNLDWHTQLICYREGARQNGIRVTRLGIIGVEQFAPHVVQVLELTPAIERLAEKRLRQLVEELRACLSADFWPGYTQDVVPMELPSWLDEDEILAEAHA